METPSKYISDITNRTLGMWNRRMLRYFFLGKNIYESNFVAGHDV